MLVISSFKPAWWAKNRHLQTVWAVLFRRLPKLPAMQRIRLELPDGDFIDVDISTPAKEHTVLLLHGLEGSIDSHYIRGMIGQLTNDGKRVVVMHFRGCSGEPNRLSKSYHSGVSDDLQTVIELLNARDISVDYLVGFSLGGNVALKWLGERHSRHQVRAAIAVSAPLLLNECASAIENGFSKFYLARLLSSLKIKARHKKQFFADSLEIDSSVIKRLSTFWAFDHLITAPLHGFSSAEDYYNKVSGQQFLKSIEIPTLVIHARDDPFMNTKVVPEETQLSESVTFELSENGGHVGFVSGSWPWKASYYLENRASRFFSEFD